MDSFDTRAYIARSLANLAANRRSIERARNLLEDVRARTAAAPRQPLAEDTRRSRAVNAASAPGTARGRHILAEAYEVSDEAIARDAHELASSLIPADEFLAVLRYRLHWPAASAVIYMAALRSLLLDRLDATPWDDC